MEENETLEFKRSTSELKEAGHEYHSAKNSLDKLGLLKAEKLLNAAVILFGKKPQQFFPNAKLRCAIFATEKSHLILDRQEFEGDLFYLINKAEEYILKNIHIGMRLEGMRRVDVPEINRDAFREAIINAFCHRNYYEYAEVQIAVFKDRVEIRSPGGLYGGLTIEQIKKTAPETREKKYPEKVGERWSEKWSEKWSETLSKRQIEILKLIMNNPRISRKELSKSIGINQSAIQKQLDKLKQAGILERIGPARGGHWEVREGWL